MCFIFYLNSSADRSGMLSFSPFHFAIFFLGHSAAFVSVCLGIGILSLLDFYLVFCLFPTSLSHLLFSFILFLLFLLLLYSYFALWFNTPTQLYFSSVASLLLYFLIPFSLMLLSPASFPLYYSQPVEQGSADLKPVDQIDSSINKVLLKHS